MLKGIGASQGYGIGKAVVIKNESLDYSSVKYSDAENEKKRLHDAVEKYCSQTQALAENLREIAPYTDFVTHTVKVTEENAEALLADAQIICEAFDKAECKAMLAEIVLDKMPEKYLVSGSGMAGLGPANAIKTRRITEHFYLCGDGVSDVDDGIGLVSARVMLCAAHQAHTILRILAGMYEV